MAPAAQVWPRAAASAIVFQDDRVLLIERGKGALRGYFSLPGGHIEPGERARDAARREVLEETGIAAEIHGLLDVHDVIMRDGTGVLTAHYVIAVHFGRHGSGTALAASDAAWAGYVPVGDIGGLTLTAGAADLIRRAKALVR